MEGCSRDCSGELYIVCHTFLLCVSHTVFLKKSYMTTAHSPSCFPLRSSSVKRAKWYVCAKSRRRLVLLCASSWVEKMCVDAFCNLLKTLLAEFLHFFPVILSLRIVDGMIFSSI